MSHICKNCTEILDDSTTLCPKCGTINNRHLNNSSDSEDVRAKLFEDWQNDLNNYSMEENADRLEEKRKKKAKKQENYYQSQRYDNGHNNKTILITFISVIVVIVILIAALQLNNYFSLYRDKALAEVLQSQESSSDDSLEAVRDNLIDTAENSAVFSAVEAVVDIDMGQAVGDFIGTIESVSSGSNGNLVAQREKEEYLNSCEFTSSFDDIVYEIADYTSKPISCVVKVNKKDPSGKIIGTFVDEYSVLTTDIILSNEQKVYMKLDKDNEVFGGYVMVYGDITGLTQDKDKNDAIEMNVKYFNILEVSDIIGLYY